MLCGILYAYSITAANRAKISRYDRIAKLSLRELLKASEVELQRSWPEVGLKTLRGQMCGCTLLLNLTWRTSGLVWSLRLHELAAETQLCGVNLLKLQTRFYRQS